MTNHIPDSDGEQGPNGRDLELKSQLDLSYGLFLKETWLLETMMIMIYNNGLELRNKGSKNSKAREIWHVRNSPLLVLKMEELCDQLAMHMASSC